MLGEFKTHINGKFPFLSKAKLLLGCSGGVDSMVLAHLLLQSGCSFAMAHCNYKLRGKASDNDEIFVHKWAKAHSLPYYVKVFDLNGQSGSIQLKARNLRYDWFHQLAKKEGFEYILTAHHADDSLETFLINLSRGTGIDGLSGIPEANNKVVRPMLTFTRSDIVAFAKKNRIEWREDVSNEELKYTRNVVRHKISTQLKKLTPWFMESFLKTQRHLRVSSQLLDDYREGLQAQLFKEQEGHIAIAIAELERLHPVKGYLYFLFREFGFTQWDDIVGLLTAQSGKEVRSSSHRLIRNRAELLLCPIALFDGQEIILGDGVTSIAEGATMVLEMVDTLSEPTPCTVFVDNEKLNYPLKLRKWKIGDYFYPLGMRGRKKLSKFFKDERYSTIQKERQWLLCSNDDIVWVVGKRLDDRFKVTERTKTILKLTCNS